MTLLMKSLLTCGFAVALAVGLSLAIVRTQTADSQQPNVPLVSFQDGTAAP
ncbi:hypothetical protein OG885_09120 [Streptomyces sp. NBC_00028]|uniref:hypothetical protein n=1 Tax=Streptomyces sp. NBC_00028 TaxID=2975624 RepID=UPI0032566FB9